MDMKDALSKTQIIPELSPSEYDREPLLEKDINVSRMEKAKCFFSSLRLILIQKKTGALGVILGLMTVAFILSDAFIKSLRMNEELCARIDDSDSRFIQQLLYIKKITEFGERPDWSHDGKHIVFLEKMYGDVWKWAGEFRKSDKNIGVKWTQIAIELKNLLDDTKYWMDNKTVHPEEIAIRFKHRIVAIHCFPNGNGRHSRMMADIIIESIFGKEVFSWHKSNMVKPDETRKNYIIALLL